MPKDPPISWDLVTANKSESKTSCLFCRCREIIRWHQWPLPNQEESLILSTNLWNAVAKEKDANLKNDVFPCKQDLQKYHEHYSSSCTNACLHVVQCFSFKSSPSLTPMTHKDRATVYKAAFSDSLCDLLVYLMGKKVSKLKIQWKSN